MPTYGFYRISRDEFILGREEFEFAFDRDALVHAMEIAGETAIEVWQGSRKIAYVVANLWALKSIIQQMRDRGALPPKH